MYKTYISNDQLLIPPNLGDFIPADAPVRLISDIVDLMGVLQNLRTFQNKRLRQRVAACLWHASNT